jgi:hypothetical protein
VAALGPSSSPYLRATTSPACQPDAYAMRSWILYRSRNPAAALAHERARRAGTERVVAGPPAPPAEG